MQPASVLCRLVALVPLVLSGCFSDNPTVCDDETVCSDGQVCDPAGGCSDLECIGLPDGSSCPLIDGSAGICIRGDCEAPRCGDFVVTPPEICDGLIASDCVSLGSGFDFGRPTCDECSGIETTRCGTAGFADVGFPGSGLVAMYAHDGILFAVANDGVIHRFDGIWTVAHQVAGVRWAGAAGIGSDNIWVVGSSAAGAGHAAHFNGTSWIDVAPEAAPTSEA